MKEREDRIAEKRRQQPREELIRKWRKAQGRHSKHYWSQETIDLVYVDARELHRHLRNAFDDLRVSDEQP